MYPGTWSTVQCQSNKVVLGFLCLKPAARRPAKAPGSHNFSRTSSWLSYGWFITAVISSQLLLSSFPSSLLCFDIVCLFNANKTNIWEALPGPGGGASGSPPYLSWLWSKFLLKNYVSPKAGINFNLFGPFSDYFFQKSQKNWGKLEIYQKIC